MKSVTSFPLLFVLMLVLSTACKQVEPKQTSDKMPNFLILMSDNHSWNHLSCYDPESVPTPSIDAVAKKGVRFTNAYCTVPSCSPARATMLAGQDAWRLQEAANLWGSFPKVKVYTEMMEEIGYHVGIEGKGWGPGNAEAGGWEHNPGGKRYDSFEAFFNEAEKGKPWMYWYSSRDPHRPYREGGWEKSGIDLASIKVPPYLPDTEEVRKDIADYFYEIQLVDQDVASYLSLVGEMGQLENTIIIICSDNGWQMPRGLANLYDFGLKIPLIISWPGQFKGGREVSDFVSLNDFAPTFLELVGIDAPAEMNAKSFVDILYSEENGRIDASRNFVVAGRERHAFVRQGGTGYPGRAIRTDDYLYVKNYESDRWPAGDPPLFGDVDAHMLHYPAPTKIYMLANRDDAAVKPLFDLAFAKRPAEELYDLAKDPYQLTNVAALPEYAALKQQLSDQLTKYLRESGDPRETDKPFDWDAAEYYQKRDLRPRPNKTAIEALGLEVAYDYLSDSE